MALQRRSRTTTAERARARGSFAAVVTARRQALDLKLKEKSPTLPASPAVR